MEITSADYGKDRKVKIDPIDTPNVIRIAIAAIIITHIIINKK